MSDEAEILIDILPLPKTYHESDSQAQLIILSLVDHNVYSRKAIVDYFGCSKYAVDKAREIKDLIKRIDYSQ